MDDIQPAMLIILCDKLGLLMIEESSNLKKRISDAFLNNHVSSITCKRLKDPYFARLRDSILKNRVEIGIGIKSGFDLNHLPSKRTLMHFVYYPYN